MARRFKGKKRPSAIPQAAGKLLDDVLRAYKLDETARGYRAMRAFHVAAGARILGRARAERVRGATLFVRVTSSAWAHELNMIKAALVEKLNRTPGGEGVMDLRFSVGPLDELPVWSAPPEPESVVEPTPDPLALSADLVRAVSEVTDPELRDDLTRLLSLARPK
jgi:hypothetical protein